MLDVVLHQPEIPPNTGNIMRLCVNTATRLHLIEPLSFDLDDAKLRRAGLDYRDFADVEIHNNFDAFIADVAPKRIIACSAWGNTTFSDFEYAKGDALLFGPESRGLDPNLLASPQLAAVVRIPMVLNSRSLNVANAVSVVLYEALRQLDYPELV